MNQAELLHAILSSDTSVAIVVTDLDGKLLNCNVGAHTVFGLSSSMSGVDCSAIFTAPDRSAGKPQQEMRDALHLGRVSSTRQHKRVDDAASFWVESQLTPVFDKAAAHKGYMRIAQDVDERMLREQSILHQSETDKVSGLSNRRAFDKRLDEAVALGIRTGGSIVLHLIDLDMFKQINDTLGHNAGDEVLRAVARRIRSMTRESDTVARFGGDEFAVLQTGAGTAVDGAVLAAKLVTLLRQPILVQGQEVHVSASIGIAVAPQDGWVASELLRKADAALYRVKHDGRNNFGYFTHELDIASRNYASDMAATRDALHKGRFHLLYQPIIGAEDGRIRSVEALLRCDDPRLAHHSVPEIIELIRKCGLIEEMSRWIVGRACDDLLAFRYDRDRFPVGVNLCARELSTFDMVATLDAAMQAHGLDARDLSIELTEHALFESHEAGRGVLAALDSRGLSIALDDFGAGYSSLGYLTDLPIKVIKLDISFVRGLPHNAATCTVVSAIITLAHTLGIEVVAEGVESAAQSDFLRDQHCDALQGYHISPPLTATQLRDFAPGRPH